MPFSPKQIECLSAKLDGSVVKERAQAGRKFSYIEGWHAIAEANRIFGFDGWNRETIDLRQLGEPREVDSKWRVAYSCKVRITVGSVVREGTGYGSGIDRDLGSAHESAIKEAETDAMKRALMTFGNPFGLALYDKDQENVEHAAPPPRQQQAPPPRQPASTASAPLDTKAQAEAIARKVKEADNIFKLDLVMEDHKEALKKLPQVTYDYLVKLYETRKRAMEQAA